MTICFIEDNKKIKNNNYEKFQQQQHHNSNNNDWTQAEQRKLPKSARWVTAEGGEMTAPSGKAACNENNNNTMLLSFSKRDNNNYNHI